MDSDDMRDYIQNFSLDKCKLGNQGYNRVLFQLFGFAGHGKSSFINSCKYVIDDCSYKIYAKTAEGGGGTTTTRSSYKLTETITLVDNRGYAIMNKDEVAEVYAQLGNFLPLDTPVVWQSGDFNDTIRRILSSEKEDKSADFIVPIFIYSARAGISDYLFNDLHHELKKSTELTGIFPTVVITHELSKNLPTIKEAFRQMGVKNMFSLENYTIENNLKTRGKHETLLRCLYEVVRDVEFRMKIKQNPINDKIQRKEILLRFIHEKEMEKAIEAERACAAGEREKAIYEAEQRARENSRCIVQ